MTDAEIRAWANEFVTNWLALDGEKYEHGANDNGYAHNPIDCLECSLVASLENFLTE
jgi:hypothetical protein